MKKVLIINKSKPSGKEIKKLLSSDYKVKNSHTYIEALKAIYSETFDIVICQHRLPDNDDVYEPNRPSSFLLLLELLENNFNGVFIHHAKNSRIERYRYNMESMILLYESLQKVKCYAFESDSTEFFKFIKAL